LELILDLKSLDIIKDKENKIIDDILIYSAGELMKKVKEEDFDFIYNIEFSKNNYLKVINIPDENAETFEEWFKWRCLELYFRNMRKEKKRI